jgi:hypothetical protein
MIRAQQHLDAPEDHRRAGRILAASFHYADHPEVMVGHGVGYFGNGAGPGSGSRGFVGGDGSGSGKIGGAGNGDGGTESGLGIGGTVVTAPSYCLCTRR